MAKVIKVKKEPTYEYSWDTWCVQYSCHCAYLAGLTSSRCKYCEQEYVATEYIAVED